MRKSKYNPFVSRVDDNFFQTLACDWFRDRRDQDIFKLGVHTRSMDTSVDHRLKVSLGRDLQEGFRSSVQSLAHVDQINHLAWRATDKPSKKQLASCSEDGTLKVMIVQFEVD
jgi:hypothetical protein